MLRRLAAVVSCVLAACGGSATEPRLVADRGVLLSATATAELSGQTLTIAPYLWRDFQPSSPSNGRPMIAVIRVQSVDGSRLPAGVSADSVWVLWGAQTWAARAVEEQPRTASAIFEVVARDGPKWGPNVRVDVVLRLHDASGTVRYVRMADQLVNRTD